VEDQRLRELLGEVREGRKTVDEALREMRYLPFEDIDFAKIDHHRTLRCGAPEVIFCSGKTPEQVAQIALRMAERGHTVLATRAEQAHYDAVKRALPQAHYRAEGRCIVMQQDRPTPRGRVLVVTAGTSDMPVSWEAAVTAEVFGAEVDLISDVGVAGIHRLLRYVEPLQQANVIVVVAGMEGALASVVAGIVSKPVIGVPTSVGYGASFGGIAPLLTMLNSCAAGVAVVNIDNGFGAGYMAALINEMAVSEPPDGQSAQEGRHAE